jgi:hypothetical protein
MNPRALSILLALLLAVSATEGRGQKALIHPELPRASSQKTLIQTVLFELPQSVKGELSLRAYQWRGEKDSLLIYEFRTAVQTFPSGPSSRTWTLDPHLKRCHLNPDFETIVKRFGIVPPGVYHLYLSLDSAAGTPAAYVGAAQDLIDSNLAPASRLRNRINKAFGAGSKDAENRFGTKLSRKSGKTDSTGTVALDRSSQKLGRNLRSVRGVSTRTAIHGGTLNSELFYEGWFLGRYELADSRSLTEKAQSEYNALKENASSQVRNELEGFRSVGSQVRDLYADDDSKKEIKGNIDLNFFSATGPDPYSALDPTYADVHGSFNTEVAGIPVNVEGYYTTQDAGRQARASYFRFRYDADKAKEKLMKLVSGYRSKFNETVAKGASLDQVYGSYRDNLVGQATQLLSSTGREFGIEESALKGGSVSGEALQASLARKMDTTGLIQKATAKAKSKGEADSSTAAIRGRYARASQKVKGGEEEIRKRQQQYAAIQQKVEKYSALLEQYRTQLHLDSVLNYAKVDKLRSGDLSYKDMAKAAEGLLPDGKLKKATTGLTHLEAGILDRYESEYTLAGQTVKGVSGGYDLGFGKVSATAGATEFVNREGTLDRYTGYLGKIDLKEHAGQKLGFVYYGYSPTKQVLRSSEFKGDVDAAYPTFARPVHVLSVTQVGHIGRDLMLQSEAAVSVQRGTPQATIGMENAAIKAAADYAVPKTSLALKGEWEHLGKEFENRSLPLTRAGTDRYTGGVAADLFRSFLHLAVTCNYLEQRNLSTTGYSTRWGFEARTRSKRYPNVQLSYKPFSTFRAVSDTMSVSRRPLFGEVWIVRATYQLKQKGGVSHRFSLSYNKNSTTADTASYHSVTAQAGYNYADRRWMAALTGGWMELPVVAPDGYVSGSSWFVGATAARTFGKVSVHAGQDLAVAPFGLQRLSTTGGASYHFTRTPVTLRCALRYSHYRVDAASASANLLAFQFGFGWRFTVPLTDKPDKL